MGPIVRPKIDVNTIRFDWSFNKVKNNIYLCTWVNYTFMALFLFIRYCIFYVGAKSFNSFVYGIQITEKRLIKAYKNICRVPL